ncbi:YjzC family protein [Peribacillus alkalitolerans]|uniref:YjzC family protein n=1 Tax=Peribacillus alkalitolerans TaxID=1550385 RepID=UPI0013D5D2D7|nr:YjzC family protein [Peribacillus alkalitolerans]
MAIFLTSDDTAPVSGTYVEVGHGGGKVKKAQQIHVNQGENLPMLSPYSIKIQHKGSVNERNRQHSWRHVQY